MNEWTKTLLFGLGAGVLVAAAVFTAPKYRDSDKFNDEGRLFFENLTDPLQVKVLEVAEYNETTASPRLFKVEYRKDLKAWVIPSHHGYSADAEKRLKETAGEVIDLKKDVFCTDLPQDFANLGVLDPLDSSLTATQGRGKRITMRDGDGNVLADFIIGKEVDGDRGMRYVRVPDQKRVYKSKTQVDISARFSDWIETDFLKLNSSEIRAVQFDLYKVDERRLLYWMDDFVLEKSKDGKWKIDDKELSQTEKVNDLTSGLDQLNIVGVRPKPVGLTADLKVAPGTKLSKETRDIFARQGFFLGEMDGQDQLVSNEGEVEVVTNEGIVYTLRFGEVLYGEGDEVTAGAETAEKKDRPKEGKENRYVLLTVRFDVKWVSPPSVDPRPERTSRFEAEPGLDPDSRRAEFERRQKEDEDWNRQSEESLKRRKDEWDRKVQGGEKKAKELNRRFANWFYVISSDNYQKIHVARKDFLPPVDGDLRKLSKPLTLSGHENRVGGIEFSSDGRRLYSASEDGTVRSWDPASGKQIGVVLKARNSIGSMSLSPDHKFVALSVVNLVGLFNPADGKEIWTFEGSPDSYIHKVLFDPSGAKIATADGDGLIKIWDPKTQKELRRLRGHKGAVLAIAAAGTLLASGGSDKTIRLWELETGKEVRTLTVDREVFALSFSHDGSTLLGAFGRRLVKLWKVDTGEELPSLACEHGCPSVLALSPDGSKVALGSPNGSISVVDLAQRKTTHLLEDHQEPISSLDFSPDGRWIASGSWDHTIKIWDLSPP